MSRRRSFLFLALGVLLAACDVGDGSRRPPFLGAVPQRWLSGDVLDPDGKAVTSAVVTIEGASERVVSQRGGRFWFPDPPLGTRRLTVDAGFASADGTDRLGSYTVQVFVPEGRVDLDLPLVVPDLASGTSATLSLGPQPAPATIDGSAASGAILEIQAGTSLSRGGSTTGSVTLNLAKVESDVLPSPLPGAVTGARLPTRGIWVSPVDVRFTPGALLDLPNDTGLPAANRVDLFRLDSGPGTWVPVGRGTVQAGGSRIRMDVADLPGGGLYVFTATIAQTTVVSGRALAPGNAPVPGALVVSMGGLATRADGNGAFVLGPLPALDGAGQPLDLPLHVTGPSGWQPVRSRQIVRASIGQTTVGDILVATRRSGFLRLLLAGRGREIALRRVGFGVEPYGSTLDSASDGKGLYFQLPVGWGAGFATWEQDAKLFRGFARAELRPGDTHMDLQVLVREEEPRPGEFRGRMAAIVLDEQFGSPLENAWVQGRHDPNTGDKARTNEIGEAFTGGERFGVVTAAYESSEGGTTVRSAYSVTGCDSNRVEFPVRTAAGTPTGSYEPYATLLGTLPNATPGKVHRVLSRPIYRANDWWNLALTGQDFARDPPRKTDPAVTGGTTYEVGMPIVRAFVTGLEGQVVQGAFVPERLGLLGDLATEQGAVLRLDLPLSFAVTQPLTLTGILAGRDASLSGAPLRYRLGARRSDGLALDLVPEAGGVQVNGQDAVVPVPPRTATLAGAEYLLALTAVGSASGATFSQSIYVPTVGPTQTPAPFLALPRITSPSAGGTTTSPSAFDVTWDVPPGTDFFELELVSAVPGDVRAWKAFVLGSQSSFRFQPLVPEAPQIVVGGRTWTLKLSAFRIGRGIAFARSDGYQRLIGNNYSLRPGERGIEARSTWEISFSTP